MSTALGLLGLLALIAANAFFVAAEFAYVAVDRTQVDLEAEKGLRPARLAAGILRRLSFHLSGAQLGITIASLGVGVLIEPAVAPLFEPVFGSFLSERSAEVWSVVLALLVATVVQMVVGELVPKSVAVARPLSVSMRVAVPFRAFVLVFRPIISACNGAANALLRLVHVEPIDELSSVRSRKELQSIVRSSEAGGTLRHQTATLLDRTFRFGEKTAADALTPRMAVRSLPFDGLVGDLLVASEATGLSRFPVVRDHDLDEVVGVVHVKDILGLPPANRRDEPLTAILRPVLMVPETKDLEDLMVELQDEGGQFAIVLDEYGSLAGIVTLEDLVEEIVGDIADEYDPASSLPRTRLWGGAHLLSGRLHPDEVREACDLEMPEGAYDTLAGFVMDRLGRIPVVGDEFLWDGWRLGVVEMDGRRVATVRLVAPSPDTGDVQ